MKVVGNTEMAENLVGKSNTKPLHLLVVLRVLSKFVLRSPSPPLPPSIASSVVQASAQKSGFQLNAESNVAFALVSLYCALLLVNKARATFSTRQ